MKKGGKLVIQVITMNEKEYPVYRKESDFIQQYVFPGSMLGSLSRIKDLASKEGLTQINSLEFGQDYAKNIKALG